MSRKTAVIALVATIMIFALLIGGSLVGLTLIDNDGGDSGQNEPSSADTDPTQGSDDNTDTSDGDQSNSSDSTNDNTDKNETVDEQEQLSQIAQQIEPVSQYGYISTPTGETGSEQRMTVRVDTDSNVANYSREFAVGDDNQTFTTETYLTEDRLYSDGKMVSRVDRPLVMEDRFGASALDIVGQILAALEDEQTELENGTQGSSSVIHLPADHYITSPVVSVNASEDIRSQTAQISVTADSDGSSTRLETVTLTTALGRTENSSENETASRTDKRTISFEYDGKQVVESVETDNPFPGELLFTEQVQGENWSVEIAGKYVVDQRNEDQYVIWEGTGYVGPDGIQDSQHVYSGYEGTMQSLHDQLVRDGRDPANASAFTYKERFTVEGKWLVSGTPDQGYTAWDGQQYYSPDGPQDSPYRFDSREEIRSDE